MANISSARGTLALSGDWAPEDIELANQVIRAWEFWGEFGLRTAGPLSLKSKRTKFEGTCRWSLADMLAEFDEWNRKWIAEPESQTDHLLSAEVYDGLLDVMFQKGLFIKISYQDKLEEGGTARGQGELVSDGKKMDFVLQFSKEERQWLKQQAAMQGVLYRYEGPDGDVVLEDGYRKIGDLAFDHRTNVTSVVIPEGVQEFGWLAFAGCENLSRIVIPKSVKKIGDSAFWDCVNLSSVMIPEGVQEIGSLAFRGCKNLSCIVIPESVKKIGKGAFVGCVNLSQVTLPAKTSVNFIAFQGTPWLKSLGEWVVQRGRLVGYYGPGGNIEIPEQVKIIESCIFEGRSDLTSITLPPTIKTIAMYAFEGCENLTSITLPPSMKTIQIKAFKGCKKLTGITLPPSVKAIAMDAFEGCEKLTIHAPAGSFAEEYARKNKIKFEALP